MSNVMRGKLTAAKTGAEESLRKKSKKDPMAAEPAAAPNDSSVVEADDEPTEPTVVELPKIPGVAGNEELFKEMRERYSHDSPISEPDEEPDEEPDAVDPDERTTNAELALAPTVTPVIAARPRVGAPRSAVVRPASRAGRRAAGDVITQLTAPGAVMGSVGETKSIVVPLTEAAYLQLQRLDRALAMSRRRPVNRVRLLVLAVQRTLADPITHHQRYVEEYMGGASWDRRIQARIPDQLAAELPSLRYTGESRQSAGMLISVAVGDLLNELESQTYSD